MLPSIYFFQYFDEKIGERGEILFLSGRKGKVAKEI